MLRTLERRLGWVIGRTKEGQAPKLTPEEQCLTSEGFKAVLREAISFTETNPILPLDRSYFALGIKGKNFPTIEFQEITDKLDESASSVAESKGFKDGRSVPLLLVIQSMNGDSQSFPNPSYTDLRRFNRINRMANNSNTALIVAAIDQIEKRVDVLCVKEPQTWGFEFASDQIEGSRQKATARQLSQARIPQEVIAILRENHYRVIPVIRIPSDTLEFSPQQLAQVRKLD